METNLAYSGKKIGILGGSFDPIHNGHLNIAKSACREFHLDEVWFIPAGHSPNKNEKEMTPTAERAQMVELAINAIPAFRLSMLEIESQETSYTYLTLTKLKERYPDTQFYFIMGADSLDYFETWCHPEIICENAIILTAVRDELDLEEIQKKISFIQTLFPAEIYPIRTGKTDVSSTELRKQIEYGKINLQMLPSKVADYIIKQGLYGYGTK